VFLDCVIEGTETFYRNKIKGVGKRYSLREGLKGWGSFGGGRGKCLKRRKDR